MYTGWCLHQTCKTLFMQMSHLKSFSAINISFLTFFVLFLSFCLPSTRSFKCLLKKYSKLSITVKFSCSLISAIQFFDRNFEFSSQTINKKESRYYVNVAYKMHISVYQAYIQDRARETSQPLKILDHQISHFESI